MASKDGLRRRGGNTDREGWAQKAEYTTPAEDDANERVPLVSSDETRKAGGGTFPSKPKDVGPSPVTPLSPAKVILDIQGWLWTLFESLKGYLPWSAPEITDVEWRKLGLFKDKTAVPFDHDDHADVLKELWKSFSPTTEMPAPISEQWKEFGFQHHDPASDFRAAGVFGIHNLLYFAKSYPKDFSRMSRSKESSYPFAITGLNITLMLLHLLGVNTKSCFSTTHNNDTASAKRARKSFVILMTSGCDGTPLEAFDLHNRLEEAFYEVYCYAFKLLDSKWVESHAGPMQFNAILLSVRQELEANLPKATSIAQLKRMHNLE